jgi:uncharacterized protein (TIGR02246 family)
MPQARLSKIVLSKTGRRVNSGRKARFIEEEFDHSGRDLLSKEKDMLRNTLLVGCLVFAAQAGGCSTAHAPAFPPDSRAADVEAVKNVEAAWIKAMATRDVEKWASFFTDDASGLYPGAEIMQGKAALKAGVAPYLADQNFSWKSEDTRAVASKGGYMVYTQGTYTVTMTNPKTKKLMTDKGKYLTIYAKQADGSWKVVADTFNSDSPM